MPLILPERKPRKHDPHIVPVRGTRGTCQLCGSYGDLTDSHILPRSAGNQRAFLAEGFLTSVTAKEDEPLKRRFTNGVSFRTLCASCNSALGGSEDKEISCLFQRVRRTLQSPLKMMPELMTFEVRPNLIFRAVLAHLVSANDSGVPSHFDNEVRAIFQGKKSLRETWINVFCWTYTGKWLTVVRDVAVTEFVGRGNDPDVLQVLKFRPLGFAITPNAKFRNRTRLNDYLLPHESLVTSLPIRLSPQDRHPHWPATTGETGIMLSGGSSGGLVATPMWRAN